MVENQFPFNVFEDVEPSEFLKHNKKQVTEDFVTENLNEIGWSVYRPFVDTGIDLVAERLVCPDEHTLWHEIYESGELLCRKCDSELIKIIRFIQVKTREIKGDETSRFFGYTLTSKDFRTDPRHVFLLYSDHSLDFLIIPVYEYLKTFYDNPSMGSSHFQVPSFRQGNNKVNSLQLINNGWFWIARGSRRVSFNKFVNLNGLSLMMDPKYDLNLDVYVSKTSRLKTALFLSYSKGRQTNDTNARKINNALNILRNYRSEEIRDKRLENIETMKEIISDELKLSIEKGYFIKFKELKKVFTE